MSKGIGAAQRAILDALADPEIVALTVTRLAEQLGRSPRQVRYAVRSLERRGMVKVARLFLGGWRGEGEYGKVVYYDPDLHEGLPVLTLRKGEFIPGATRPSVDAMQARRVLRTTDLTEKGKARLEQRARERKPVRAPEDGQYVWSGMPATSELTVWLPERWRAHRIAELEFSIGGRMALGNPPLQSQKWRDKLAADIDELEALKLEEQRGEHDG